MALLLILSIGNYFRIEGSGTIRTVQFFSILLIGIFAGILISDVAHLLRSKPSDKNKII